ncbi:hypothetical protein [Pseudobdellovibrio exovorus]|uniref:HTH merR-type domain-containing protein n=1 Tax=Pseudobdellovibrio exovorus JSS TaxID=1184267 RepID=M4V908_9BACT|nr:hypothetical protein [Pseudobdellovibrio exovorus]AGH94935.1 hypothetical protein A11Q_715 [Pseudobdellovibrio exovorus JSS]
MSSMNSNDFLKSAHLLLGITKEELNRRLQSGVLDPQILKAQIEQNSHETQREALCEKWIAMQSLEQIDLDKEDIE